MMLDALKNRNRGEYTFANINLLGKCNADCFFCLGKDIEELLSNHDQTNTHFSDWNNFGLFLEHCRKYQIRKLYITGQNTDALLYKYLSEIIDYLQGNGFSVGLRTNGFKAESLLEAINKCNDEIGYSINSLDPKINCKIMGSYYIPNWEKILSETNNCRVSIVISRFNLHEINNIIKFVSGFKNVKYIQLRRISTDTRLELLAPDIQIFENLYADYCAQYDPIGDFNLAPRFNIYGKEVVFWRTVSTSANSINYFTDGTISDEYFVVEGYLKGQKPI